MAKTADLREKSAADLDLQLVELCREQFNLRFQRAVGQNEGVGRVRKVRREIAQVKTILAEKKRSAQVA